MTSHFPCPGSAALPTCRIRRSSLLARVARTLSPQRYGDGTNIPLLAPCSCYTFPLLFLSRSPLEDPVPRRPPLSFRGWHRPNCSCHRPQGGPWETPIHPAIGRWPVPRAALGLPAGGLAGGPQIRFWMRQCLQPMLQRRRVAHAEGKYARKGCISRQG